ncbi:MAG: YCF48-related protein [Chitinophagales bacterium]
MKKIYFLLFLTFLQQASFAQEWTLTGFAFANTVRGIYFHNADTGFAAGAGGFISKSIDGGVTWTPQTSGVITDLRSIEFVNDTLGYSSGASGVVLKTTNSGVTWTLMNSGISAITLRSIDFTSADTGLVGGSAGIIYKTTDGGVSWTSISLGILSDIINLHMYNKNAGYAVASDGSFFNGYVFKTTDGGSSWTQIYTDPNIGFLGVAVGDSNTVYAGGKGQTIIKTNDGGATWSTVYSDITTQNIRSGFAVSANEAYFVDDFGYVASTMDGGVTWKDTLVSFSGLYSIYFPNPFIGYTGDGSGNIYGIEMPCAVPAAPAVINGSDTVCSGTPENYSISAVENANSYQWSVPADAVINSGQGDTVINVTFGALSGNIYVTGVSDFCGGGDTATISVTVNPSPQPSITFSDTVLTSSDASGNQWYFNNAPISGATDSTYTPTQNGNYYVVVTNSYGCTGSSNVINVLGVVIKQVEDNHLLHIEPLPAHDDILIQLPQVQQALLSIYDDAGRKVFEQDNISGNELRLNVSSFGSGIYLVRLLSDQGKLIGSQRMVVQ